MEFNCDVAGSVELEDAARPIPIERDLRVRVVVQEHGFALRAESDRLLEVIVRRGRCGGVVGIVEIHESRTTRDRLGQLVERDQEVVLRSQRAQVGITPRQRDTTQLRLVAWLRDDGGIAFVQKRKRNVRKPVLGSDER